MIGDRLPDQRQAAPAVAEQPAPEIPALPRPAHRTPGAAHEREVEEDNRVRRREPGAQGGVMGAEGPIHDPCLPPGELALRALPFSGRRRVEARFPELPVQFDDGQSGDLPQARREHRLAGGPAAQDDHALHSESSYLRYQQISSVKPTRRYSAGGSSPSVALMIRERQPSAMPASTQCASIAWAMPRCRNGTRVPRLNTS